MAGDVLGDGLDDDAGQGPFESRTPDVRVHHLDQRRRTGDHTHVVGAGQCEPGGDLAVALYGFGESFTVQHKSAARHYGRADHAMLKPAMPCCSRARSRASRLV